MFTQTTQTLVLDDQKLEQANGMTMFGAMTKKQRNAQENAGPHEMRPWHCCHSKSKELGIDTPQFGRFFKERTNANSMATSRQRHQKMVHTYSCFRVKQMMYSLSTGKTDTNRWLTGWRSTIWSTKRRATRLDLCDCQVWAPTREPQNGNSFGRYTYKKGQHQ